MEKILSVYWFAILVLVAGAIFLMVSGFYSYPYDVRVLEADILADKVAHCFSQNGNLNSNLFDSESEGGYNQEFKDTFPLNCNILISEEDPEYLVVAGFYDVSNLNEPDFEILAGNLNWRGFCEIQSEDSQESLPKCVEKRVYSLDSQGNQHLIKILSVVGKVKENVRL